MAKELAHWQNRIGHQRSFLWRGLQVRYCFWRSPNHSTPSENTSETPLVLIHGFGASIEHWRGFIPKVAGDRPVYSIDLLGFGGSEKGHFNFGVPLWVEQLHYFLETVVAEPVLIMGNSIGSLVTAVLTERYPEKVKAIALLSVPDVAQRQEMIPTSLRPIVGKIEQTTMQPWLIRRIFYFLRRRGVLKNWLKLAYPSLNILSEELIDIIAEPTMDLGVVDAFIALSRRVSRPEFCPPMKKVLPAISCPILMLWGEKDRFVPVAIAPTLAKTNPKITLKILPNLGHCPHDEDPDLVYRLFTQWLGEIDHL
ncbi:alpha/beta fold hydrolase [[Leptolyngbya] sp. PCC 7376]|uniref:alpha/beta fold hydrolase n=1 Tax=[Leptolyngbya] sp. PCC 7376 TaxID=111781 RepID=UPI0005A171AA|nr:alpha/beta fold hydrolase [[Leptolyngbya] sp. PCC 7376]